SQPTQPVIPPVITPVVPPLAPIPVVPSSLVRPLAPLPVRPPVIKPPVPQNGDLGSSDSESDGDDADTRINKGTGECEISEESRLVRERQEKAMQDLMMR
ncbi:hypothetical protein KIW84_062668, partial [Lathyrus oleraceus]